MDQVYDMKEPAIVMLFDKTNSQKDYAFIAEDLNGKERTGYIVIDKPWYAPQSEWVYWLYFNEYEPDGFCGGCSTKMMRIKVKDNTIRPATQINMIRHYLKNGLAVKLVSSIPDGKTIVFIEKEDDIPTDLYEK